MVPIAEVIEIKKQLKKKDRKNAFLELEEESVNDK